MIRLRPHRWWLGMLVLSVTIMAGSGPLCDTLREKALQNLAQIKTSRAKVEQDLQQLRDDVTAAHKLSAQIDGVRAEQVLAPVDRLKVAEKLEQEASGIEHFTYTVTPEEHVTITSGGEKQDLASSTVTLAGEAADDVKIYAFLERVRQLLPGRARLKKFVIARRTGTLGPTANVRFDAAFEWLSNGAVQTVASGP
jgi:hypothetical protein